MAQDIRKLFKEKEHLTTHKMKKGHEERFLQKLEIVLPKHRKNSFFIFQIAASVTVLIAVSYFSYQYLNKNKNIHDNNTVVETKKDEPTIENGITLGDISPELKKVQDYYLANINLELLEIEVTPENKQLFDSYINRLEELDEEYKTLNEELNSIGPNEYTVTALINNLQLRLQLLYKLKDKLKELKEKTNETVKDQQA
ncbi:hypothetical protein [Leptobacterium sp. I13]|uniref:hypothetical protein n=1 Tax=Leptobacterium meishanense TaxID=3128904 RepID=UPI0030ED405B